MPPYLPPTNLPCYAQTYHFTTYLNLTFKVNSLEIRNHKNSNCFSNYEILKNTIKSFMVQYLKKSYLPWIFQCSGDFMGTQTFPYFCHIHSPQHKHSVNRASTNNSQQIKPVNHCCKALHLRCLGQF